MSLISPLPPGVVAPNLEPGCYTEQLLVIGPDRPWHRRLRHLIDAAPLGPAAPLHEPWGPIPLELILAGATS